MIMNKLYYVVGLVDFCFLFTLIKERAKDIFIISSPNNTLSAYKKKKYSIKL